MAIPPVDDPSVATPPVASSRGAKPLRAKSPMAYSRRTINLILGAFLLLQLGLLARAALPLPKPLKSGWPWRMFDRRSVWEKRLEADALDLHGSSVRIPLEALFTYTRGFTPLRAYDQATSLNDSKAVAFHQDFALYLAKRMRDRGVLVSQVSLYWHRYQLETGAEKRELIGQFAILPDFSGTTVLKAWTTEPGGKSRQTPKSAAAQQAQQLPRPIGAASSDEEDADGN